MGRDGITTLHPILRSPVTVARTPGLSVGLLLGAALLYALPQAFESGANQRGLCAALLAGLLGFFLLEKWATLQRARRPALAPHAAADAILIAAAFSARPELGVLATPAIGARAAGGFGRLWSSSLAAAAGLACCLAPARPLAWMPYVLVLASSGFLYIALSELVPKIQQPASNRDTIVQLLLLGIGVSVVLYFSGRSAAE